MRERTETGGSDRMKGIHGFEHVLGLQRELRGIRRDFNRARKVGNVRYGRYFVFFPGMEKWMYIGYDDIVWAYRRLGEIPGKKGKEADAETHFLMLATREKKRFGVSVGEKENALTGLKILQEHSFIDIGYSKEKEEKYL